MARKKVKTSIVRDLYGAQRMLEMALEHAVEFHEKPKTYVNVDRLRELAEWIELDLAAMIKDLAQATLDFHWEGTCAGVEALRSNPNKKRK